MSQKQIYTTFYCLLLAGSSVCFWNNLQDATLLPRVLFAFVCLLLFSPLWYRLLWNKPLELHLPDLFFSGYVFFHFLSIIQAINRPEAFFESAKIFMVFICYLLFKEGLLQNKVSASALLKTLFFVCLGYSLFAISQLVDLSRMATLEGDNLYAINALAGHKNLYSGLLVTTSCLLGILVITENGIWRYLSGGIILLQAILLLLLQTRSAFLALLAVAVVLAVGLFFQNQKSALPVFKKLILPATAGFIILIAILAANGTLTSFYNRLNFAHYLTSDTGSERLALWYKSAYIIQDHWLTGVGARNWMLVFPYYSYKGMFRLMYLNVSFLQPHNDFIWVWCELGIGGLIAFTGIFLSFFYRIITSVKTLANSNTRFILILLLAQQVGFMVFSFFDFPKERMEHQITLALGWALISYYTNKSGYTIKLKTIAVNILVMASILLLFFNTTGVWQRMKADSLVRDLLAASERGDNQSVILLVEKMETPYSNLTPLSFPKQWYKGVAYYALGKQDLAYQCFKEAKKHSPYNPNVLNNLGGMQTYFKHYDDALDTYKETLRINDKNDDARFNTAYTLYQLGRYQEALDSVQKVWSNKAKKEEFVHIISQALDSVNNKPVLKSSN